MELPQPNIEGTGNGARVEVRRGPSVLDELGADLDALLAATGAPITARRPWLNAWIRSFTTFEPVAITVHTGHRLDAAALLVIRKRLGRTEIYPMGFGPSDYARFPARDEIATDRLGAALVELCNELSGPWRSVFSPMPMGDPVLDRVVNGFSYAERVPVESSPVLRFAPGAELAEVASKGVLRSVRRIRRDVERAGSQLEVSFVRDPEAIHRLLPDLEAMRQRRDRSAGRETAFHTPAWVSFLDNVLPELAGRGELEIALLNLDGARAAYSVGLLDGASYRRWHTRFDPAQAEVSPGTLLRVSVLERVLNDGQFTECDFMTGVYPWKLQLTNELVPAEKVLIWSNAWLRSTERQARRLRDAVNSLVKRA